MRKGKGDEDDKDLLYTCMKLSKNKKKEERKNLSRARFRMFIKIDQEFLFLIFWKGPWDSIEPDDILTYFWRSASLGVLLSLTLFSTVADSMSLANSALSPMSMKDVVDQVHFVCHLTFDVGKTNDRNNKVCHYCYHNSSFGS